MQAIVTRYIGPGNVRGSRMTAKASAGSTSIEYDDALNVAANHAAAAKRLCDKFGWRGTYWAGGLPNSADVVWVGQDDGGTERNPTFITN